jgi:hypothetical protein
LRPETLTRGPGNRKSVESSGTEIDADDYFGMIARMSQSMLLIGGVANNRWKKSSESIEINGGGIMLT